MRLLPQVVPTSEAEGWASSARPKAEPVTKQPTTDAQEVRLLPQVASTSEAEGWASSARPKAEPVTKQSTADAKEMRLIWQKTQPAR